MYSQEVLQICWFFFYFRFIENFKKYSYWLLVIVCFFCFFFFRQILHYGTVIIGYYIFRSKGKIKKSQCFNGTTTRSFRKIPWSFLGFCARSVGLEANNTEHYVKKWFFFSVNLKKIKLSLCFDE